MPTTSKSKLWHAYNTQKLNAAKRTKRTKEIQFNLAFDEWLALWNESGKLDLRGRGRGRYCMSRYGDQGHYEVGNVFIQTFEQNAQDCSVNRKRS